MHAYTLHCALQNDINIRQSILTFKLATVTWLFQFQPLRDGWNPMVLVYFLLFFFPCGKEPNKTKQNYPACDAVGHRLHNTTGCKTHFSPSYRICRVADAPGPRHHTLAHPVRRALTPRPRRRLHSRCTRNYPHGTRRNPSNCSPTIRAATPNNVFVENKPINRHGGRDKRHCDTARLLRRYGGRMHFKPVRAASRAYVDVWMCGRVTVRWGFALARRHHLK